MKKSKDSSERDGKTNSWEYRTFYLSLITLLVGTGLTLYVFLQQRQYRAISYGIVSASPILNPEFPPLGRLELSYRGQDITTPSFLAVQIENRGNVPITPDDFKENITLLFEGEDLNILDIEVSSFEPKHMGFSYEYSSIRKFISIQPFLFNPNDKIRVYVLLDGPVPSVKAIGRIVGVHDLERVEYSVLTKTLYADTRRGIHIGMIYACIIFVILIVIYFYSEERGKRGSNNPIVSAEDSPE